MEPTIGVEGSDAGAPGVFWRQGAWWRRAGQSSAALWTASAAALATSAIAARGLGVTSYGRLVLAISVATLVSTFLDLTLSEGVVHHGYRMLRSGDHAGLRGLLWSATVIDVAIGVGVTAALFAAAEPLADVLGSGRITADLLRLAALTPLAATLDSTTTAALLLLGRPELRAAMMCLTSLLRMLAVAVTAFVGGPALVLCGFAVAAAAGSVAQLVVTRRLVARAWPEVAAERDLGRWAGVLARFGVHSSVTSSLASANLAITPIIVGRVAGASSVGLFDAALFPVSLANVGSGPIRLVLLPEQARLSAEGNAAVLARSVRIYVLAAAAIAVPAVIIGWFALPTLIRLLFGEGFAGSVAPARVLLIAAAAALIQGWAKTFPAAIGRPQVRTMVSLGELVATAVLLWLLARESLTGAAWAVSIVTVLTATAWWLLGRRLLAGFARETAPPVASS